MIDIIEQEIVNMSKDLFDVLLTDRTTKKNICWATENYMSYGSAYYPQEPITMDLITGEKTKIIQPRVIKNLTEQNKRTKEKAEVFTPSWVCNEQNNLIDEAWFGRKDVFNVTENKSWKTIEDPIAFPKSKNWKQYVNANRLEITCGEAPYLVSRYDTVTGEEIPLKERIGLLDRKLRIVSENTVTEEEWLKWAKKAYQSIYGYEYQGDSLLIARENLLHTFTENMEAKFFHKPSEKQMIDIAKIISWNIWQMDGITMVAPYSERDCINTQLSLFGLTQNKEPIPCRIYDWKAKTSLEFKSLVKGSVTDEQ